MKVLYLVNHYPRPSHTFIRREILALEERGVEVVRVSIRDSGQDLVEEADRREASRTLVLLKRGWSGLVFGGLAFAARHPLRFLRGLGRSLRLSRGGEPGLVRQIAYLLEACQVTRIATEAGVDHVHAHFGTNAAMVALLVEALGGPGFSFTIHGPEEFDRVRGLKLAEKVAASRFVVAISDFGAAQLRRCAHSADHAKIAVVRCGLDLQDFAIDANDGIFPSDDFLFVGRLCPQKEPLFLLEAMARLRDDGCPARLRIGGSGELMDEVRSRIRSLRLEDHVHLLGVLDGAGVIEQLRSCRSLVLPSSAEGLPVVLMEALALRRPVISTFVAGIPELVRAGENGWLVPTGDRVALVQAMKSALDLSREEWIERGVAGERRVRERHDIRRSAKELHQWFERVVHGTEAASESSR